LIAVDLPVGDGEIVPGAPTIVIDHHAPLGLPQAEVISGWGMDPIPTSSLLAWWAAAAIAEVDDLLWLAALGLVGDMAEASGFAEMEEARRRYGVTAIRTATSLINAPRRAGSGDAAPALALLLRCRHPKEIVSGEQPETAALLAAKAEVAAELARTRRVAPKVRGDVALIRFASPCQIHPLIAQAWRGRLKNQIVMAANTGFRPGWIHFAVRTARDLDLLAFLAERAPPGADENYGSGHRQATGGALRPADWNAFVRGLGFDPEDEVSA
jgi:single-stranded-DNA-specific exonuclease